MTDKNTKYLTVKQAAELTGKSESTIKRIVRDSKRNPKHFMFEKLPTGREKIFVSKSFLDLYFNGQNSTVNQRSNERSHERLNESSNAIYLKTIEILERELESKNKQIDELLERQRESNILLLGNKQVLQLEEKPKRWWQRKK